MTGALATWLAVVALAVNYGARAVVPVVAHVVCRSAGCDAASLIGSVASAFFTGDLLAQAAAKPLVRRFGGQRLLSAGIGGIGGSLALVTILVEGPLPAFLAAQAIFGFCCGLGYPASHALIAEVVPASKRSTAVSLIVGASAAGTMLSNFATPLAVDRLGWLAPFAFFSAASTVAAILVEVFCPTGSCAAPQAAKAQPLAAAPKIQGGGGAELLRWMKDPLIQAMVLAMYASGVANAFLYSFIPTLFVEVYRVKLTELAWLTTAAPLVNAVTCVISGVLADNLIGRGWPQHRCRRLMQLLGTAVPAASLLGLALGAAGGTAGAAVLVTAWMSAHGFQTAGLTAAFHDVGKLRASELFAVGNVFSKLAGVLAGQAFSRVARAWGWEVVLLTIAAHYISSGVIFIALLGRSEQTRLLITPEEPPDKIVTRTATDPHMKPGASEKRYSRSPSLSICSVASTSAPDPACDPGALPDSEEDQDTELLEDVKALAATAHFRGGQKVLQGDELDS